MNALDQSAIRASPVIRTVNLVLKEDHWKEDFKVVSEDRISLLLLTQVSPKYNFPHKRLMPNCNGDYWPKYITRLDMYDLVHHSQMTYRNKP